MKCNRRSGAGGQFVELPSCFKTSSLPRKAAKANGQPHQAQVPESPKNPHHYENYTRNLMVVPSGQIRKCSIWLIIQFNGMKVII
ncbi:hypothetical protein ACMA1I_22970 [Pontibacter sp. 13R65]|uniref:hypothetical protein n=1 Tax=Pontibacter sp. 13R65 TaxID=3127458 RepID=UPI00301BDF32